MIAKSNVEIHPTLIVGLGGTGHDVLLDLKKRLLEQFEQVPPIIQLLAFDTAEPIKRFATTLSGESVELELNRERFLLRVEDPSSIIGPHNPHIEEWWPHGTLVSEIVSGATQIRARGRLALFANYVEIKNLITRSLTEIRKVDNIDLMRSSDFSVAQGRNAEVYVVSSLAGGTGSGMFLDIAFIARYVLSSSNIVGLFVMPRVFTRLPGTHFIGPNSYAALKEIEHFSKLRDTDRIQIDYGSNKVKVKRPPFDLVYLLDSMNEQERIIDDPQILFSRIAQGIQVQIGSEVGVSNRNVMDNILGNLDSAGIVENRSVRYCSFGVSSCTWAHKEFDRIFEKRKIELAKQLISILLSAPSEHSDHQTDAVRFLQDLNLTLDQLDTLRRRLSEQKEGKPLTFEMPVSTLTFNRDAGNKIRGKAASFVAEAQENIRILVAANYEKMAAELEQSLDEWHTEHASILGFLSSMPSFLHCVSKEAHSLKRQVEKEFAGCQARLNNIDLDRRESLLDGAARAFFWPQKKMREACVEYGGAIEFQCKLMLKAEQHQRTIELINLFLTRIETLLLWCQNARLNLGEVASSLEKRETAFGEQAVGAQIPGSFEGVLPVMPKIIERPIEIMQFIRSSRNKYGSFRRFIEKTASESESHIIEFVHETCGVPAHVSIDDILEISAREGHALNFSSLSHLAAPLWRFNSSEIPLKRRTVNRLAYCSVKNGKAHHLKNSKGGWFSGIEPEFIAATDDDHITFFNVTEGVPLFALHGMREMEAEYHDLANSACHLHRDWRNLPDVVPKHIVSNLCCFAVAQSASFALIKNDATNGYTAHLNHSGSSLEVHLGPTWATAYAEFEKRREVWQNVRTSIEKTMDGKSWQSIREELERHIDYLSGHASTNGTNHSEKEFIQSEIEAVREYLSEMGG